MGGWCRRGRNSRHPKRAAILRPGNYPLRPRLGTPAVHVVPDLPSDIDGQPAPEVLAFVTRLALRGVGHQPDHDAATLGYPDYSVERDI